MTVEEVNGRRDPIQDRAERANGDGLGADHNRRGNGPDWILRSLTRRLWAEATVRWARWYVPCPLGPCEGSPCRGAQLRHHAHGVGDVPHPHRAVASAAGHALAVGAE